MGPNFFSKQQKFFLFNALFVWGLSQLVLQLLLWLSKVSIATLTSQIIYIILGFQLYGKNVFNMKKYSNYFLLKFIIMSSFLWAINFCGINLLDSFFYNKNIAAITMIPILAVISFLLQKYYVFIR